MFHNFAKDACQWDGSVVSRVWFKAFLVDWGNQCLKPVVGEFACVVWLLEDVRDDGGNLFCSFLEDSSWEFVWASSFILVEIFQLFNYAVCANVKRGHAGVQWRIYYRNGVSFAIEYRGKLVVEGICLITVVRDWSIIHSQGWDANVFSFVCLDEWPESFWICF